MYGFPFQDVQHSSTQEMHQRAVVMSGQEVGGRESGQFLDGDPAWWVAPPARKGRDESKVERVERLWSGYQNRKSMDVAPPDSWKGWKRQRERPMLTWYLFPVSWSAFFLTVGFLFLFFDQDKSFSPWIGAGLSLLAPASLFLCTMFIVSKRFTEQSSIIFVRSLGNYWNLCTSLLILMTIWWCWNGKLDPSDPFWFAFIFLSLIVWLWWISSVSQALAVRSARWLLPVEKQFSLPRNEMESSGWEWHQPHDMWVTGSIASIRIGGEGKLFLKGELIAKTAFLSLHWETPQGWAWDPWQSTEQVIPMSELASFFSLSVDHGTVASVLRGLDISSLSSLKAKWPDWCRPEVLAEPEEE